MRYLHTMVRVKDLDQSLDFYCNKLGLKEVNRYDSDKGRFTLVFLASPDDVARMGGMLGGRPCCGGGAMADASVPWNWGGAPPNACPS